MFKNYVLVTLRNLRKNSVYSFINIAGLAIGITCSLMIFLWVFDELSYDHFQPKLKNLYQLNVSSKFNGTINTWNSVPLPTYEGLKTESPAIKNVAVSDWGGDHLLTVGETGIRKQGYYASEEFLTMFQFSFVKGNPATALADPSSIAISESTAKAMFGDKDPINQIIRVDNFDELKVSGVFRDVPKNSTFQFDCLLPWKLNDTRDWVKRNRDNWGNYSFQVYVELNDPASKAAVEKKIADLLTRHGEVDIKHDLFLYPMERWRLHYNFENGKEVGGQIYYVQMFTIIAVFILIIACINFMNLSTARSERRAREVGIRKSVGSSRIEIIWQFLGESLFISTVACVIAVVLAQLLMPLYNDLVEKKLSIGYGSPQFWFAIVGLILFTGVISGSYPAFYLSSFQPVKVLKGKIQVGKSASLPRRILVTLQFGFSILLIIGMIVIYQQIQHVKARDIGYKQDNLINVDDTSELSKNFLSLKDELLQSGVVNSVTRSNSSITQINSNNFLGWPGKPESLRVIFATIATEYDYSKTMGIKVLQGRDFSQDFKSDSSAILVNQAGLDVMGLKDPLGAQLDLWGGKKTLIGILDNVVMQSPYQPIRPLFVVYTKDWFNSITVRIEKTKDLKGSLKKIEAIFKKYNPAYPFEYNFADVEFAKKFNTINMISSLATLFASLAIVITGLGLFGLAAFTAEQRTKEIGIRKVMGASIRSLVGLMSKDFSMLVVLAFIISSPIAWWLLTKFILEKYPYHTGIVWWIFPLTGLVALAFALIIVSTQALRAARANPANSLRSE
jgi:putative ABC transport system permease protein